MYVFTSCFCFYLFATLGRQQLFVLFFSSVRAGSVMMATEHRPDFFLTRFAPCFHARHLLLCRLQELHRNTLLRCQTLCALVTIAFFFSPLLCSALSYVTELNRLNSSSSKKLSLSSSRCPSKAAACAAAVVAPAFVGASDGTVFTFHVITDPSSKQATRYFESAEKLTWRTGVCNLQ